MSHAGSDERAGIAGGRIQRKTLGSQKFILKTPKVMDKNKFTCID